MSDPVRKIQTAMKTAREYGQQAGLEMLSDYYRTDKAYPPELVMLLRLSDNTLDIAADVHVVVIGWEKSPRTSGFWLFSVPIDTPPDDIDKMLDTYIQNIKHEIDGIDGLAPGLHQTVYG